MQNDTSKFVVNIIPLQNVITNVGGTNPTTILSNTVVGIQQMVNTNTKTINTNFLQSYTPNAQIGVLSGLNLCNVGITSNGLPFSGTSSNISISTLTVSDNITVGTSGTFGGICYAQQFVTLSDILAKKDMRELTGPVLNDIAKIHAYQFSYSGDSTQNIGLLAQEVGEVWPQLLQEGVKGKYVNYDGVVALLVKAVQELVGRVSTLESGACEHS